MRTRWLNRLALVLALAGVSVSGLLSLERAIDLQLPCGKRDVCSLVSSSPGATPLGVPLAYLGLAAYLVLALSCGARLLSARRGAWTRLGYAVSGFGALASVALVVYSHRSLGLICPWCLASAFIMAASFAVHAVLSLAGEADALRDPEGIAFGAGAFLIASALVWHFVAGATTDYDARALRTMSLSDLAPPNAPTFGSPAAPVKIVFFGDVLCPACRNALPELKEIVQETPGTALVYRHNPIHHASWPLELATEMARDSGEFWKCLEEIHRIPGYDKSAAKALARRHRVQGQTYPELQKGQPEVYARIMADRQTAKRLGVDYSPAVFLAARGAPSLGLRSREVRQALRAFPFSQILRR